MAYSEATGSIWGLTYDRTEQVIYMSAFLKRHVDIGPNGLDAIYMFDKTTDTVGLWAEVSNMGVNVGSDDLGVRGLAGINDPSRDVIAYNATLRRGFGDIELDRITRTMWFINLEDRQLYGISNVTPENGSLKTSDDIIGPFDVQPGEITCVDGLLRPFGLKVYRGFLYIGAVCTGEIGTKDPAAHTGHVIRMDLQNHGNFEEVLGFRMDYNARRHYDDSFQTWYKCDVRDRINFRSCHHGAVSSIDFDRDGNMVIAIMDRYGHTMVSLD